MLLHSDKTEVNLATSTFNNRLSEKVFKGSALAPGQNKQKKAYSRTVWDKFFQMIDLIAHCAGFQMINVNVQMLDLIVQMVTLQVDK